MNFSFSHEFDVDVATFWKMFLSEPFNVGLYKELKMRNRTVLKSEDDGKRMHRVVKFEPTTPIPGFLQSVVKTSDYSEIDTLDYATNTMKVVIETEMFKDKFSMQGLFVVTPVDGGKRCRREFKGDVKVSIPLLGGKIEKFMMEQVRDSYDVASAFTRSYIAQKKAAGEL